MTDPRHGDVVVIAFPFIATPTHLLPCKVSVTQHSPQGRQAGLRLDSVIDCQTIATAAAGH